jgi:predicted dehydrogenase
MPNKVRWGVLSTAGIGVKKVIPAMQKGEWIEVVAIASRHQGKAEETARALGIAKAYGSYEELLADPQIEAIYNPLPNQLHVPWSIRAAEAGKHVLCEKPLSMTVAEAKTLLAVQQRTGVTIGEAFMVRTHPQWLRTRELIASGRIGQLRSVQGFFSYFNTDPKNIRNIAECGGGALMDIGCYPINTSRFVFGEEPLRVSGLIERDPTSKVDRLTSAILEFPSGHATFTCSTQLAPYQRMQLLGTKSLSMRPMIGLAVSLSTMDEICSVGESRLRRFPPATNTPFKAMYFRAPCGKANRCPCRSQTRLKTWRSSRRYFVQRSLGRGCRPRGSIRN